MFYKINQQSNWVKFSISDYRLFCIKHNNITVLSCPPQIIDLWSKAFEAGICSIHSNKSDMDHLLRGGFLEITDCAANTHIDLGTTPCLTPVLVTKLNSSHPLIKSPKIRNAIYINSSIPHRVHHPTTFFVDLHYKCNLHCKHCYIGEEHKGTPLSRPENITRVLQKLCDLHVNQIILIGGEPFLDQNLMDYVAYADKCHIKTTIATNGTLPIIIDSIAELIKHNVELEISLDGPNEKIHSILRGQGAFAKTVNTISQLAQQNIKVVINYTLTKKNIFQIIPTFLLANRLGAQEFLLISFMSSGTGKHNTATFQLSRLHLIIVSIMESILQLLGTFTKIKYINLRNYCGAKFAPAVNSDGDIFYCVNFDKNRSIGNIFKDHAWWDQKYYDQKLIKGPCSTCFFRPKCGASDCRAEIYARTGDFFHGNEHCLRGKISKLFYRKKMP